MSALTISKEDEKRGIKVFTETGRTVSDDRKGIDRDHQSAVRAEPAERDGAFPVRHPRRAPGFQPCAEKCLRCDQAQSERDIQQHAARLREEGALHADLLSGTKTGTDPATRKRPGRLVSDHAEPTGTRLPERLVQIHALESAQGPAEGVLLHHPGTAPRVKRRAEQVRLCGPDHQHDHLDRPGQ